MWRVKLQGLRLGKDRGAPVEGGEQLLELSPLLPSTVNQVTCMRKPFLQSVLLSCIPLPSWLLKQELESHEVDLMSVRALIL